MGVIKLIQDIKLRRHRQQNPPLHNSHFSPVHCSPYHRFKYTCHITDPHNLLNFSTVPTPSFPSSVGKYLDKFI